jgi:hypothetical protein
MCSLPAENKGGEKADSMPERTVRPEHQVITVYQSMD